MKAFGERYQIALTRWAVEPGVRIRSAIAFNNATLTGLSLLAEGSAGIEPAASLTEQRSRAGQSNPGVRIRSAIALWRP